MLNVPEAKMNQDGALKPPTLKKLSKISAHAIPAPASETIAN
jgi:hypothetical protein